MINYYSFIDFLLLANFRFRSEIINMESKKSFFQTYYSWPKSFRLGKQSYLKQYKEQNCLIAFRAAFLTIMMNYACFKHKINIFNCKVERYTSAFLFASSMLSRAFTMGNMSVFKYFVICQMNLDKNYFWLFDLLTRW